MRSNPAEVLEFDDFFLDLKSGDLMYPTDREARELREEKRACSCMVRTGMQPTMMPTLISTMLAGPWLVTGGVTLDKEAKTNEVIATGIKFHVTSPVCTSLRR